MDDARLVDRVHRLQHLLPQETHKIHVDRRVLALVSGKKRLQIRLSVLHQLRFASKRDDYNVQLLGLRVDLVIDKVDNPRLPTQAAEESHLVDVVLQLAPGEILQIDALEGEHIILFVEHLVHNAAASLAHFVQANERLLVNLRSTAPHREDIDCVEMGKEGDGFLHGDNGLRFADSFHRFATLLVLFGWNAFQGIVGLSNTLLGLLGDISRMTLQ